MNNQVQYQKNDSFIQKKSFYLLLIGFILGILFEGKFNLFEFFGPKRVQVELKYQPKDLDYNLDANKALIVIMNPTENKEILWMLIQEMQLKLLHHFGNTHSLSIEEHQALDAVYEEKKVMLINNFITKLIQLIDEKDAEKKDWYRIRGQNAVEAFEEVMGLQACNLLQEILPEVLGTTTFEVIKRGAKDPCQTILTTGVTPMVKRLAQSARVFDLRERQDALNEQIASAVTKLSTTEIKEKKGLKREIVKKLIGIKYSTAYYEMYGISIIGIGFNIKDNIQISFSDKENKIIIFLPEPEILYHEVFPMFKEFSSGIFANPDDKILNSDMNLLREEFRKDLKPEHFEKAKKEAEEFLKLLIGGSCPNCSVEIKFENNMQEKENLQ